MGLPSVECEEFSSGFEEFEDVKSSETGGKVSRSRLVVVEQLIPTTIICRVLDERRKVIRNGIISILEGLDTCNDEQFEVSTSCDLG